MLYVGTLGQWSCRLSFVVCMCAGARCGVGSKANREKDKKNFAAAFRLTEQLRDKIIDGVGKGLEDVVALQQVVAGQHVAKREADMLLAKMLGEGGIDVVVSNDTDFVLQTLCAAMIKFGMCGTR